MLDPKLLRESPDLVRAAIAKKHLDADLDAALALDAQWRDVTVKLEIARAEKKAASKKVGELRHKQKIAGTAPVTSGIDPNTELAALYGAEAVKASQKEKELEPLEAELKAKLHAANLTLPNIPHASVPDGKNPEDNVIYGLWGLPETYLNKVSLGMRLGKVDNIEPSSAWPCALPHWEIPKFDRIVDFARGSKVTGAGFPFYVGDGARIVRALLQFFLDEAGKAGYVEVNPPIFVNAASATAVGQLPDKEGQMYQTVEDSLYAVPTAETPLTNFFRDEIIDEAALPVKRTGYTPCFRREAGSYGKDVRGLNRLHQFDKVELLKWVHPSTSYDELDQLRVDAENLLQKLGLPYRVLLMCGGDMGFAQAKKYDLEVWAAGQKRWLEVSSCSNFETFQARRAQIRFRPKDGGKPELVHTINGSGLAVPRVLAALLENNLQPDGRVKLPAVLVPYFGREYLSFA